jgi:hypothetical protein
LGCHGAEMPKNGELANVDNGAAAFFEALDDDHRAQAEGLEAGAARDGAPKASDPLDNWRILLIQTVHLLSSFFMNARYWEGVKGGKDTFDQLIKALAKLATASGHDGALLIRYRGMPSAQKAASANDYLVVFGKLSLDTATATAVINRQGLKMSHLAGRLGKAFGIFADQGIMNLYLELPEKNDADVENLRLSLEIVSRFHQARRNNAPIVLGQGGKLVSLPLIKDGQGSPDPNLTLVAGVNHLSAAQMDQLVAKVNLYIQQNFGDTAEENLPSIFSLLFRIKSLKGKLARPPVEVNNVRWLMVGRGEKITAATEKDLDPDEGGAAVTAEIPLGILQPRRPGEGNAANDTPVAAGQGNIGTTSEPGVGGHTGSGGWASGGQGSASGGPLPGPDQVMVDRKVIAFIEAHLGDSLENQGEVIESLYRDDYVQLDSSNFSERLQKATDLLRSLERNPKGEEILDSVIESIQQRVEMVSDDVFDAMTIVNDRIQFKPEDGGKETVLEKVHSSLLSMISLFKERSATKKKFAVIKHQGLDFGQVDYAALAQQFNMTDNEASSIVGLLKRCFDPRGFFVRTEFEARIPDFLSHEKNIFEFLWGYLKETLVRKDRVSFLNSLQLLIHQLQQPKKALRFLLADLCQAPREVHFSDRNALMLSSLLVRTYNKELTTDIELTPEEVLLVKNGLDPDIIKYAAWRIDVDKGRFQDKLNTVHSQLLTALKGDQWQTVAPPRFLLSLEREAMIFLSLIAGKTARNTLVDLLQFYGNPHDEVYHLPQSRAMLSLLFQQLKLIVRAMGRVADIEDVNILAQLKQKEERFARIGDGSLTNQAQNVRRIMHQADISMRTITALE